MLLRARHLFAAWLAYGVLQLVLLGVVGAPGAACELGARDARTRSESHAISFGKRTVPAELRDHRHTPVTPFAPPAYVRFELAAIAAHDRVSSSTNRAPTRHACVLPPSRAPPALS